MTEDYSAEAAQFACDGYAVLRGLCDQHFQAEPVHEGASRIVAPLFHPDATWLPDGARLVYPAGDIE